jgi:tetratricopeptide (TPR) repeat protein
MMDQLSAHLDRGWDLAQRGDVQGAHASARRAIELCPDSPEAHNLLGYVAALEGDCEEAMEAYQQAISLDDTYVEAMLNAAELCVHPMANFDEAVDLCDQVLGLTDYQDEIIDAQLLKFDALLGSGDEEGARRVLASLPDGPYELATHNYLTGRAWYELGDLERAGKLLEAALAAEPDNPDLLYYLGLLREEQGDHRAACEALLRSRQLDLQMGMPSWGPNAETFTKFTERAVAELSDDLKPFVDKAELYIADLPGPEVLVDGVDPRALVMVDALPTPLTSGEAPPEGDEPVVLRVFLYVLNVLRSAGTLHAVQPAIRDALEAELRHVVFGEAREGDAEAQPEE